jgi:sugar/nucleoside kinase (ribokinase family)
VQPTPASPKRKRPRLVALGDLTLDIVVWPDRALAQGSDVGGRVAFRIGGSAANAARSFAAAGGDAVFVGAVGDDRLGRRLVRGLRAAGVRSRVSVAASTPTARLIVMIGPGGERSFITARGAADCLAPADLGRLWFRGIGALHLPAYSLLNEPLGSAAVLAAGWTHEFGALVSVDLASAEPLRATGGWRSWVAIAAVNPDVLFANADEAAVLTADHGAPSASTLLELAPIVVIKHGPAGCAVLRRGADDEMFVETERVKAADTTGAGDAFDAGFLFELLGGTAADDAPTSGPPDDAPASRPPDDAPASGPADYEDRLLSAARAGHAAAAALLTGPRVELEV